MSFTIKLSTCELQLLQNIILLVSTKTLLFCKHLAWSGRCNCCTSGIEPPTRTPHLTGATPPRSRDYDSFLINLSGLYPVHLFQTAINYSPVESILKFNLKEAGTVVTCSCGERFLQDRGVDPLWRSGLEEMFLLSVLYFCVLSILLF